MSAVCKISCRSTRRRRLTASISALVATSCSAAALAGPAAVRFDISEAPLPQQLATLAIHSNISIGGVDPAACAAKPQAIHGAFEPAQALQRLLSQSNCAVTAINATTYRLTLKPARPQPRPQHAAPPSPVTAPAEPEEITVLVNRRPERIGSAAQAISIVPSSIIQSGAFDLAQLAYSVPGMAVTNLGPGRDKILLRGLSDSVLTGRTQSLVGLYIDDTPLTYNAPDPDLLLVDMARVEVLKGPQGALYGQGSMSGVVRLVTNKPDPGAFSDGFETALGLSQRGQPSERASAMVNLPIIPDQLALRTVLYEDQSGGFIKDPAAGRKATNLTRRSGGRVAAQWRVGGGFVLTGTILGQHLQSNNSQYVTTGAGPGGGPFTRTTPLAEPHNNDIRDTSLGLEGPTPVGTLKVAVNQVRHHVFSGYDAQPLAQVVSVPNSGVLFYDEEQNIRLETAEISLISPSQQSFRWLTGLFAATSDEHFMPHLVDAVSGRILYNENRLDSIQDKALFGEIAWDFTPKWTLSIGARDGVTRHETQSQINHVRLTGYRSGGGTGIIDAGHLSATSALRYQPNARTTWYLQVANGYRNGGFNTTTLATLAVPTTYAGDAMTSYEGGWRYRTADNRLRMNVAVFHMLWRDIQSDQLRSTGLPITLNIGNGVNTGVEVESDWKVTPVFTIHGAAQVNDPRLDQPATFLRAKKSQGMPYIAKRNFSLSGLWDTGWLGHPIENTAIVTYRSQSPLNYGILSNVRMNGYATLDLASAVVLGRVRYEARLDNATDVTSNSFAYGNPFTLSGSTQVTPLRPRTLWLSAGTGF